MPELTKTARRRQPALIVGRVLVSLRTACPPSIEGAASYRDRRPHPAAAPASTTRLPAPTPTRDGRRRNDRCATACSHSSARRRLPRRPTYQGRAGGTDAIP